jgi:hypothetical protein
MRAWLALIALTALAAGCGGPSSPPATPTPIPIAPTIREIGNRSIAVEGQGSGESDPVMPDYTGLPIGVDVVSLTHDGRSSFIVNAVQGGGAQSETLLSAIGPYKGDRPLVVEGPVVFQVTADGNWTVTLRPMQQGGTPTFKGSGDGVSAYFTPPAKGSFDITHDGQTQFVVTAQCVGGSLGVEDKPGAVDDGAVITFPRGPCFWEVRADGKWSITPQSSSPGAAATLAPSPGPAGRD